MAATEATNTQLEVNKAVVRRFVVEIFGHQDLDAVDELVGEDFSPHTWGPMPPGRKPLREAMRRAAAGVSDATFEIHQLIAEGDLVAARLTSSATHTGTFMGIPPTGRRYSIDEIHIFRLRDGQVIEHWHEFDPGALIRQLKEEGSGDPSA
ncbi:MAG TPA: ester cyclase [Candidatus Limnocylindrales bacterium]|nr:ester cyclase [Candidatus Limnocylindrales bacterium]